jgi:hypothetical protein
LGGCCTTVGIFFKALPWVREEKAKPACFWTGFVIYGVILSGSQNLTGFFTDKPILQNNLGGFSATWWGRVAYPWLFTYGVTVCFADSHPVSCST